MTNDIFQDAASDLPKEEPYEIWFVQDNGIPEQGIKPYQGAHLYILQTLDQCGVDYTMCDSETGINDGFGSAYTVQAQKTPMKRFIDATSKRLTITKKSESLAAPDPSPLGLPH